MMCFKRALVAGAILCCSVSMAFAQYDSAESSYLQDEVELMIIQEQSQADNRDMKLVAIKYIDEAIGRGNNGKEVRDALEYMGLEGVLSKSRESGRVLNNFPDVRTKVATSLGDMGTPEAKSILVKMVMADNEPMVLTEVIKSLGRMEITDNDPAVISAIAWVAGRFNALNPDNLLALSVIETYEKMAERHNGIQDAEALRTLISFSEGPYIRPVKNKARQLIEKLRQYKGEGK